MAYKIRVILDVEEDVIRDIIVNETISLENLHFTIAKSFGFSGQEMASFYRADEDWEQGIEIPLCNMSEDDDDISMDNCSLTEVLRRKGDKLIYVYDFFAMWTFFIELTDNKATLKEGNSKTVFSFGDAPEKAPEKEFTSESIYGDVDIDDFNDEFESLDDMDFDNY
ncbi:hypothetical protein EC396_16700 [Lutibacter sp. HS1-25]|uniref:IS1096 element passenger TnpR family protein n=1 Tax=Lutibacter sp. HS1-25 TaxID=2485000 RepID=UPI00101169BD|nr:hypothetical protein [Lutibacter sp. HS1-25]RXP44851.1 hypothetical protein EC396_16700 [Lutibacter sp. HS1-25]